jgi:hypothetical protein
MWIADLVRHGPIQASFVPRKALCELRELLRYRHKTVEVQAAERNRLQRQLETANVKLASVASDVLGNSGRAILRALIDGTASPAEMADLALGKLCAKRADLTLALDGRLEPTTASCSACSWPGWKPPRPISRSWTRRLPKSWGHTTVP